MSWVSHHKVITGIGAAALILALIGVGTSGGDNDTMKTAIAAGSARIFTKTAEVSAALDISDSTVRAYHSRGRMPAPSGQLGRTPYWTAADLAPWVASVLAHRTDSASI